jgi:hypothetical protein
MGGLSENVRRLLNSEAANGKRTVRLLSHQETAAILQSPAAAAEEVKYQEIATILRFFVSRTEDVDGASVETCIEALKRIKVKQAVVTPEGEAASKLNRYHINHSLS